MIKNKRVLAVIPARAGSKGLPGKNIKDLLGKPLIAWTIEAALGSKYIDEIIVSTDGAEIAKISESFGANIPFLRPKEISEDTTTSIAVLEHALNFYKNSIGEEFDYVIMLEPTSPLRDAKDIDDAFDVLFNSPAEASAIVGICKTESQNPAFLVHLVKDNLIEGYANKDMKVLRRQDIEPVYFFEGSLYISKVRTLLDKKTFYHSATIGYEFPKWKSLEIDDGDDFIMVEALLRSRLNNA